MANSKVSPSKVLDINQKTGALILGSERLDDYAAKYLNTRCKEALTTPMPLPVEEILQAEGLSVKEVSLSRNLDIFACCMLLDGDVNIFDKESGEYRQKYFKAGTILIDPDSVSKYGEGFRRNSLIHEALHWEKDKRYFEILKVKNADATEKLCPIMCRQSQTFYEPPQGKKTKENEVRWLEWQAHRLAPRVLMPKDAFRKKALETIDNCKDPHNNMLPLCDTVVEVLSEFFIVSRESVKYRLQEVGLEDKLREFDDYETIFAELNSRREYVPLTPVEAYQMLTKYPDLEEWVTGGNFIFVDGYFVLADKKYVQMKDGRLHLTAAAKKNLKKCAINVCAHRVSVGRYLNKKDFINFAVLYRTPAGGCQEILAFHSKYQANLDAFEKTLKEKDYKEAYDAFINSVSEIDDSEETELVKMVADPQITLCQCLWFLMENRKWLYPEKFNELTSLHKNYHGKIKNNNYNNMGKKTLLAICVGMGINIRMIELLFQKRQILLNRYTQPDKTYYYILEKLPGITVDGFNSILRDLHIPELGTKENF